MNFYARVSFSVTAILSMCCIFNINCEGDPMVKLEDIIVDYVNEYYFDIDTFDISTNYNQDSENTLRLRVDVIRELPPVIFVKMKVLGRAFGQYKVPTGISLNVDVCDGAIQKYFLEHIFKTIGADFVCPPAPGIYEKDEIDPDIKGLPLYALPGLHVLVDIEVYSPNDITLIKVKSYSQIN